MLNDKLTCELDAEEADTELEKQLDYSQKVERVAEAVDAYLQSRLNDTPSIMSDLGRDDDDHFVHSNDTAGADADMRGASRSDTLDADVKEVTAHQVGNLPTRSMTTAEAPDQWIDECVTDRALTNITYRNSCRRSTVRAEMDPYDGTASKWFAWIGQFKALVHDTSVSPAEKLAVLRSSLRGDCRDIIYALDGGEDAYKEAFRSLKASCGRRDVIRAAHLQTLDKLEPGKSTNQLKRFAERVCTHLFDLSRIGETANTYIMDRFVAKLTIHDCLAWHEVCQRDREPFRLVEFGDWLCSRAAGYQNAYEVAAEQSSNARREVPEKNVRNQARTHTMNAQEERDRRRYDCPGKHLLSDCNSFKRLEVNRRWQLVRKKKLCFTCLQALHRSTECRKSKSCNINGCRSMHHPLLDREQEPSQANEANVNSSCSKRGQVALGVITVYVIDHSGKKVAAGLFFDEGSDKSFVRERFLSKLRLDDPEPVHGSLMTHGFAGVKRCFSSRLVNLTIVRLDGEARFDIVANRAPTLCDPVPTISWSKIKSMWKHLADLPLVESRSRIDILLGRDHADLMSATESRGGNVREPVAMNTSLGWIARGVISKGWSPSSARMNLSITNADEDLTAQFRRFCQTEAFGTEELVCRKMAPEYELAIQIVESGTRKLEVGFEVPLPWRAGEPNLPCNRALAESRLQALLRRFEREPSHKAEYKKAIDKCLSAGYAHEVTDESELTVKEQYFLPHHGVRKKATSTQKLRIVFDSSAIYKGRSLNSALLTGPPLQNELPLMLLKFSEGKVAIAADIEAMFSRIRLCPEDARYHRFLWRDQDSEKVKAFQMDRLTFGDTCSQLFAISTIMRTACEFGKGKEEAVKAIQDNVYMADYLDSARAIQEAISRAQDMRDILREGDFHLTKWISNCKEGTFPNYNHIGGSVVALDGAARGLAYWACLIGWLFGKSYWLRRRTWSR